MESKDWGGGCGDFRRTNVLNSLKECMDDIFTYLRRYHLSRENISEYQLILTLAGHFRLNEAKVSDMFMCPRHLGNLRMCWKCTKSVCQYLEHKEKQKAVKGDRVFNVQPSRDVNDVFGIIILVGSREYSNSTHKNACT